MVVIAYDTIRSLIEGRCNTIMERRCVTYAADCGPELAYTLGFFCITSLGSWSMGLESKRKRRNQRYSVAFEALVSHITTLPY